MSTGVETGIFYGPCHGNDPDRHDRRSMRLHGYDYRQGGWYFVTICTRDRHCTFGDVLEGRMYLNGCGRIAAEEWRRTAVLRPYVRLDAFVVMPNHVHGLLGIVDRDRPTVDHRDDDVGAQRAAPLHGKMPNVEPQSLGAYKSAITRRINQVYGTPGAKVWQRNYHDRIIRNERGLHAVRQYIADKPARWHRDRLHR